MKTQIREEELLYDNNAHTSICALASTIWPLLLSDVSQFISSAHSPRIIVHTRYFNNAWVRLVGAGYEVEINHRIMLLAIGTSALDS